MTFSKETTDEITQYMTHIENEQWFEKKQFYNVVTDNPTRKRIIEEFQSARYIYKFFEGTRVTQKFLRAQIRVQVLMYASIIEAATDFVLKEYLSNTKEYKKMLQKDGWLKVIEIPESKEAIELLDKMAKSYGVTRDDIKIFTTRDETEVTLKKVKDKNPFPELDRLAEILKQDRQNIVVKKITRNTKNAEEKFLSVKFSDKVDVLKSLNILDNTEREDDNSKFYEDLKEIYLARNMIHIEAEMKKNGAKKMNLDYGKLAYLRATGFSTLLNQNKDKLEKAREMK
ncbi:hypothetical protein [Leuconostoc gelidum]|uniref:Uncharacterized protein n=1 Tax=Leuconostoc gelidum subsp. gelidum TaxID=1607839 RepID=A0ABS7V449_LEUGE|nr:hypothetical protein [Leuconostoc gelidum]MBZ5978292.1 hypothetical protein [Leuconostoc gelidum subsp. gelidum]MBZ6000159.1 hypothetical protein [Leuconostoc gelidum subsp. gelidum]